MRRFVIATLAALFALPATATAAPCPGADPCPSRQDLDADDRLRRQIRDGAEALNSPAIDEIGGFLAIALAGRDLRQHLAHGVEPIGGDIRAVERTLRRRLQPARWGGNDNLVLADGLLCCRG